MTSTIISKHLQSSLSTASTSPLLSAILLSSILLFAFPSFPLDGLYNGPVTDFTCNPYIYFYLHLCLFLSSFLSLFPMLLCLTFYIWGPDFHLHIVVGDPLAGLHPFLLGSPARCTNHCS